MANNLIQIKRTSVSGRPANTTTLPNPGELALNMPDGILYSTNGSVVFEIGANNTNVRVSNTLTVKAISANGSNGSSGQVLTTNGTATYWTTPSTGGDTIPTQNTAPEGVSDGKLYWNEDLGKLLLYYDDGDTQQWVEAAPSGAVGPQGLTGEAATVIVGSVNTGEPGSNVDVTNSGNSTYAILDFTIPRGNTGTPASISVGSTTTSNAGTFANVVNIGTTSDVILTFSIPRGETGDKSGLLYNFSTSTSGVNPAPGTIRFNNTTFSSITRVYINENTIDSINVNNLIAQAIDGTSSNKSVLLIKSNSPTSNVLASFTVTTGAQLSSSETWYELNVTPLSGSSFTNSEEIVLEIYRIGDKGDTGNTGPTGPIGPFGPKSITIAQPQATDNVTMFFTTSNVTVNRIQTLVKGTSPTTNTSFYVINGGTTYTIQNNISTSNQTYGTATTSFSNSTILANSYVYVTVHATTGTVDEFHATLDIS